MGVPTVPFSGSDSSIRQQASRISRRAIIWGGVSVAASVLAAACAPTRTLPPSPGARANGAAAGPRPAQAPDTDASVGRATPTPRPKPSNSPAAAASPTPSEPLAQATRSDAGRDYLTRPATTGTIQFLHGWDGPRTPLIETVMAEFGTRYAGIEIEAEPLDPVRLHDQLVTALASGSPPNTVMLRSDSTAYFAEQRALLPLDDLMARDRVSAGWFGPRELATRSWDGALYGLPKIAAGAEQLLFVNVGLLQRLDRDPADQVNTWQQLESLVEPARRAGVLAIDPTRCGGGVPALQVWTYANGGRWLDEAAKRIAWADPAGQEAAAWIQKLVAAQRIGAPGLPAVGGNPSMPLSVQEWLAEKHVCCINDASWIYQLRQLAPQLQFAVYESPRNADNPASDGRAPSFGGWMLAIPREAQNQAPAWEWLKFAAVSQAAEQLMAQQQLPSALVTTRGGAEPADVRSGSSVVVASVQHSVPVPALPISGQLDDIARGAQAEIIAQQQPPQRTLETAARSAQRLLDDWQARRRRT